MTAQARFASMEIPVFRQLVIGGTFSFLAMMVSTTARAWLAFELTGSNAALGGVMIGFGLSSIVMIPVGGVLADRLAKRTILLTTAIAQGAVSLVLGLAVAFDSAAYWMLLVASLIQGAVISLLGPARLAFVAEALDRDRLTNGVLLSQSSMQFTRVFGPAIAGALIGVQMIGIAGVYFIAAACSLFALALSVPLPAGRSERNSGRSPLADLADGVRFVRSNRAIRQLLLLSYLVVLFGFPYATFLPVMADDIFNAGSAGFGFLTTAGAIGALVATLALADVAPKRVGPIQAGAAVAFGVVLTVFGVAPTFFVALAVMVLVGASSAAFQALNNSLVLTSTPVEYHGRVQSLLMLGFSGFGLAALPFGLIADAVGLRPTLVAMGIAVTLIATGSILLQSRQTPPPTANL